MENKELYPLKEERPLQEYPSPKTPSLEEAGRAPRNTLPLHLFIKEPDIPEGISRKLTPPEHQEHLSTIAKINKELFTLSQESLTYRELLHSVYQRTTLLHNKKHALQAALLSPIPKISLGKKEQNPLEQLSSEQLARLESLVEEIISSREKKEGGGEDESSPRQ